MFIATHNFKINSHSILKLCIGYYVAIIKNMAFNQGNNWPISFIGQQLNLERSTLILVNIMKVRMQLDEL